MEPLISENVLNIYNPPDTSNIFVAYEPLKFEDLQVVNNTLKNLISVFKGLKMGIEATGEHRLYGTGELFLDTVLGHIRKYYTYAPIRLSDPSCNFMETCKEPSHALIPEIDDMGN